MEIQGEFSIPYVSISIFFACLGAYTAFTMNERVNNNSLLPKNLWFILASFAMGFGIWSMHYMGMFAFELPVYVRFNPILTVLSLIPIMFTSFLAFYISYRKEVSLKIALVGSVIMGIGVVSMHFMGMLSMMSGTLHHYHNTVMVLTFVIAFFAFFLFYTLRNYLYVIAIRIVTAILMGICLSLTHYVAMFGMHIFVNKNIEIFDEVMPIASRYQSAVFLTSVFFVIILFLLISSIADKYTQYRAENYDAITRLPNLRMFEQSIVSNQYTAVAMWDFKNLQQFTEQVTYLIGERRIRDIAECIEFNKPIGSEVYRVDQHQFVVMSKKNNADFNMGLQQISDRLVEPFDLKGINQVSPAVICVCSIQRTSEQTKELVEQVKRVLTTDGLEYNRQIIHFDAAIHKKTLDEELVQGIYHSMVNDELFLVYQPKVNPMSDEVISVEALVRWNHPKYGFISPATFIPILEKNDLIFDVTDWIIQQVCNQLVEWREKNTPVSKVSINIPGKYVTNPHLVDILMRMIKNCQLTTDQIELEITETSYVGNINEAMIAVENFRRLGFLVALDDFGTGLSSLSYLKQLSITTLKIDKSFIDEVPTSEKDSEIIRAIVSLAKSLKLSVVIEGVEKQEQVDFILNNFQQIDIQGYFYSKPLEPNELAEWLQHHEESKIVN